MASAMEGKRLQNAIKRVLDVLIAATALVLLSPILLVVAAAVKLSSKGPIFHRQKRLMKHRREFTLLKFRTMVVGADGMMDQVFHLNEASPPFFKAPNDSRITPLGKLLRSAFIDELPQLVNVLRGEMSLVGPRPCLPAEARAVQDAVDFRFAVPQGLTGPAQTDRVCAATLQGQLQLEWDYIVSWSLARDLNILVRTIPLVWRRVGV